MLFRSKFVDAKTRTWVEFLRTHLPKVIARDKALLAEVGQALAEDDAVPVRAGDAGGSEGHAAGR